VDGKGGCVSKQCPTDENVGFQQLHLKDQKELYVFFEMIKLRTAH